MGGAVFSDSLADMVCLLNSTRIRDILESLNPTIHFTAGDVNRVPLWKIEHSGEILAQLDSEFSAHEQVREPSVEFQRPGESRWSSAQQWAQAAVDRPAGSGLPHFNPAEDKESASDHISFAMGIALGRFDPKGDGILNPIDTVPPLPRGILFLDGTLEPIDVRDSLQNDGCSHLHEVWSQFGDRIYAGGLREYLRRQFFEEVHRRMYDNRPIHWPLSSTKRTFVAWITIHRWNDQTLRVLLADHLQPTLTRLDGEIDDLTAARGSADKKAARHAEQRYEDVKAWREELVEFMVAVEQCADKGPAPPDPKKPEREVDTRYIPDLDDGVMINSAALWPLLEPQWKDPKKWWKALVAAKGKKDYDWSHLAMHYWPTRVDKKCQTDPSLGVAHGCFWKYHPVRAWAWELRLQDEIGSSFRIEETSCRGDGGDAEHRAAYLHNHPSEALEAVEKEVLRRRKKQKRPQSDLTLLESGVWSSIPEECWDLEMRLSKKQKSEFRLLAPDEPKSRAEFEQQNPAEVEARKKLLKKPKQMSLLADADDEGDAA